MHPIDRLSKLAPLRKSLLLAALCVTGCSSPAKQAVENVRTVRSIWAEWALISKMGGRLTDSYAEQMREHAQQQLASVAKAAHQPQGRASAEIAALAQVPPNPDSGALQAKVMLAKALEARIEGQ